MGIETLLGENLERATVLILHPTALHDAINPKKLARSKTEANYGVGELGSAAFEFIDFLCKTGTLAWQINPFGHTGYGNSPYQTFSRFAGSPYLISIEKLYEKGHLTKRDHDKYVRAVDKAKIPLDQTDFGWLFENKLGRNWSSKGILRVAYHNFIGKEDENKAYKDFCKNQKSWLEGYANFMAIKELHNHKGWNEWDEKFRNRNKWRRNRKKLFSQNPDLEKTINFYKYLQFVFFSQWEAVVSYAKEKKRIIIGDLPWYVGYDSSDVWANQEIFKLSEEGTPTHVAGVPPDYFSANGQLWGNPIYNWDNPDTYQWWVKSIEFLLENVNLVRFDHARALDTYWEVSQEWAETEKTAINGMWLKGPGKKLLQAIKDHLVSKKKMTENGQLPFVFEDLGYLDKVYPSIDSYPEDIEEDKKFPIHPDFAKMIKKKQKAVKEGLLEDGGYDPRIALDKILEEYDLPWMAVAQFGFEDKRMHPENLPYSCVAYTGTHDNDTTHGWCESNDYPAHFIFDLLKMVLASKAVLAGCTWQDLWGLGSEMRTNLPGDIEREGGWWRSRLTQEKIATADENVAIGLIEFNRSYDRFSE